jgi:hypothetical protein
MSSTPHGSELKVRKPRRVSKPVSVLASTAFASAVAFLAAAALSGGSVAATASAASTPLTQRIDMKVLVITQTTTEPGYGDWVAELNREGMPFDTLVTGTTTALPTLQDTLSDGTPEAKYMGVVVATGGTEGLTTA